MTNSTDIVDALRSVNARHEWFKANGVMQEAADLIQSQQALIEEMREALTLSAEALDLAADEVGAWGAYAAGYFQEKHDLPGCVNEVKEAANSARQALSQKDQIDG